jgi:pyruvate, water dikinase
MELSRPLAELRRADEPRFGGKSASLGELLSAGIPVPPGFALSVDASEPSLVRREVSRHYRGLGDDAPVAVRSSAIGEDSADATYAGQLETYLWVRGVEPVCDAVRKCQASLHGELAVSYRERIGATADAIGVAVQLMVDAAVSGVMFTCNPVSGDPSMVAINASWGLGLAVVSGEVTPDDFLVSKVTGEVVREHVHTKQIQYVAGAERTDVPHDRQDVRCLDDAQVHALLDAAKNVERYFGTHQDIEWAIDRDGELFILQSRPVTTVKKRKAAPADAMSLVMQTFGARQPDAS